MTQTHWKKLSNPNYLGAYSLDDGKDIILTIAKVKQEPVMGSDGKKEDCIVCHWKEDVKPMILNVTNCKTISKLAGTPYIENWSGLTVQIGIEKVRAFGDMVEALRVKKTKPAQKKEEQVFVCEECGQVIKPCFGMSAEQFAKYSKEQLGKSVCEDCANRLAKEGKV